MDVVTELVIFVLAAFVGFEVISKVPTTLHTPLMSQTNAIHGIVMLGGLIVIGYSDDLLEDVIGTIAIAFGAINIVGGFMVTDRMLGMFTRKKPKPQRASRILRWRVRFGWVCRGHVLSLLAVLEAGGDLATILYIVAFSMFILGVRGGTHPTTAKQGNLLAAAGMVVAVVTTLLLDGIGNWGLLIVGLLIGTTVGIVASLRVQMTEMPQMVALYNGVGGGAVALIAWSEFRHGLSEIDHGIWTEIPLETFVPDPLLDGRRLDFLLGLQYRLRQAPGFDPHASDVGPGTAGDQRVASDRDRRRLHRARHQQRRSQPAAVHRRADCRRDPRQPGGAANRRGGHAGRDLAAERLHWPLRGGGRNGARQRRSDRRRHPGRQLGNDSDHGNGDGYESLRRQRSLRRFRRRPQRRAGAGGGEERPHVSIGAQDAAIKLAYADTVVIVPGYGLAVAQAQHAVKELANELEKKGVTVQYAIHPVAGRMPGHMNVLLAEADVPYEMLREMDDINPEMPRTDVAVVIGANDVTNPAAKNDPDSPIAGMPIIEVSEAQEVIVIKRSLSPGFAGIDNDLFYEPNTSMLFADAKQAAADIASEIPNL